ncbi:unnamed protein product [Vitrella brassicaformis CCMP3155]|uniref:Uncharacterized protein n=4 Tax=Vitrella brassicaformis TaxID=1169539 RepID=A0A0G4ECP7_VITBC|nr:unnamed protein product [Vitrella brassicaformis CCMP3155]|eukprot:CEL93317.1 unnamed protein product [Vitrella brassicaformis CCMP3155]
MLEALQPIVGTTLCVWVILQSLPIGLSTRRITGWIHLHPLTDERRPALRRRVNNRTARVGHGSSGVLRPLALIFNSTTQRAGPRADPVYRTQLSEADAEEDEELEYPAAWRFVEAAETGDLSDSPLSQANMKAAPTMSLRMAATSTRAFGGMEAREVPFARAAVMRGAPGSFFNGTTIHLPSLPAFDGKPAVFGKQFPALTPRQEASKPTESPRIGAPVFPAFSLRFGRHVASPQFNTTFGRIFPPPKPSHATPALVQRLASAKHTNATRILSATSPASAPVAANELAKAAKPLEHLGSQDNAVGAKDATEAKEGAGESMAANELEKAAKPLEHLGSQETAVGAKDATEAKEGAGESKDEAAKEAVEVHVTSTGHFAFREPNLCSNKPCGLGARTALDLDASHMPGLGCRSKGMDEKPVCDCPEGDGGDWPFARQPLDKNHVLFDLYRENPLTKAAVPEWSTCTARDGHGKIGVTCGSPDDCAERDTGLVCDLTEFNIYQLVVCQPSNSLGLSPDEFAFPSWDSGERPNAIHKKAKACCIPAETKAHSLHCSHNSDCCGSDICRYNRKCGKCLHSPGTADLRADNRPPMCVYDSECCDNLICGVNNYCQKRGEDDLSAHVLLARS